MNTPLGHERHEAALARLDALRASRIVCFGASAAGARAIAFLGSVGLSPDFVCDNDPTKERTDFCGYAVRSPDALFREEPNLFVLIASMYRREIASQLERYPEIAGSLFHLELFPWALLPSSLERPAPGVRRPSAFNPDIRLLARYDGCPEAREAELEQARAFGISGFVDADGDAPMRPECLDYAVCANRAVFEGEYAAPLELADVPYNFDALHYKRLLEAYVMARYHRNDTAHPIVVTPWSLLRHAPFLEATAAVLDGGWNTRREFAATTQNFEKKRPHALIWHLYHVEMFDEMLAELGGLAASFDLYVSLPAECPEETLRHIAKSLPEARLFLFENRGRDILPFISLFRRIAPLGYESLCKIHTKRSPFRADGAAWGRELRTGLFGAAPSIPERFARNAAAGAFVSASNRRLVGPHLDANGENIRFLCDLLGIAFRDDFTFPLGSMFWCRPEAIAQLCDERLEERYFALEGGSIDGQIEHAVEMLVGLLIAANGFTLEEV